MSELKKLLIVTNQLSANAKSDEADVLEQAELVERAAEKLGFLTSRLEFSFQLSEIIDEIKNFSPDIIFNLVESVGNKGEFIYFAPSIFNSLKIPYAGCSVETIFLTATKALSKKVMQANGIPTPDFHEFGMLNFNPEKKYILKPVWEDGSLDLDEHSIFQGNDAERIIKFISENKNHYFAEEFIEGREFNISMIGKKNEMTILPIAEIVFNEFPEGKPKIVGYKAKWDEDSFECKNTIRKFNTLNDEKLSKKLLVLCNHCATVFELNGFARVDFRVNEVGEPFVLEVNANPCISPDSGFIAAAEQACLTVEDVINEIIKSCN